MRIRRDLRVGHGALVRDHQANHFDVAHAYPAHNAFDCSLWHQINVTLREQEKKFPKSKRESMEEFKARLRRAALSLPEDKVKKAVGSVARRCKII